MNLPNVLFPESAPKLSRAEAALALLLGAVRREMDCGVFMKQEPRLFVLEAFGIEMSLRFCAIPM